MDEAEQASLEVDNLKAELADSMALQLQKMKESDEEKAKLKEEMENLETEIAVLRNTKAGKGLLVCKKPLNWLKIFRLLRQIQSFERRYWMLSVLAWVTF